MDIFDNGNAHPISAGDRHAPRLDGDAYCSPACGMGCKRAEFDRASELALGIAKRLGGGWKPHVWENTGWHFEVKKGIATITVDDEGFYVGALVFVMSETNRVWIEKKGDDPRAVVEALSAELEERIAGLKRAILSISLDVVEVPFDAGIASQTLDVKERSPC